VHKSLLDLWQDNSQLSLKNSSHIVNDIEVNYLIENFFAVHVTINYRC